MAATGAVTFKLALLFYIILNVKKPSFTSAITQIYSIRGEIACDHKDYYYSSYVWLLYRDKNIFLQPKAALKMLLILAGDVELCPGPRSRCQKCEKCFRRNTDKVPCAKCMEIFHRKCIYVENRVDFICNFCLHQDQPLNSTDDVRYSVKELESLSQFSGLKIVHQNIRGLFRKVGEISNLLFSYTIYYRYIQC